MTKLEEVASHLPASPVYLCPVVDPLNPLPIWRAVHVVGVFRCACWEQCQGTSNLVSVRVVDSQTAAVNFPFSQLLPFRSELVGKSVLIR